MIKKIAIITPSWIIKKKKDFTGGVKHLEQLGFRFANKPFPRRIPDENTKLRQIHDAFRRRDVDLVLAQRGGYSSLKLLPRVNWGLIKKHPKTLAGFSDLSTLLNATYERTGLVTLHSPMVVNFSSASRFTVHSFLNAVNGFPEKDLFRGAPVKVFRPGIARGRLKGGNLITLTSLIGTDWELKTAGAILFLEEVDEKPHGIDRCLTHLALRGMFRGIRGLVLGDFRGVPAKEVYRIIAAQVKLNCPVVHCPYIGHVKNKITIPVGRLAELSTGRKSLVLR
jgi:muramoyltetrapeptide carboxypeptidase